MLPGIIPVLNRAVAAAVAATTWNPADIHPPGNVILSNANLTATFTVGGYNGVRSIASATSGKKYWEVHLDAGTNVNGNLAAVGVADGAAALNTYLGSSTSVGWATGTLYGASPPGAISTYATGDTLCLALDISALLIWVRVNGGIWNGGGAANPATGIGGASIIAISAGAAIFAACQNFTNTDSFTANFGGSAYAQTPPAGFGNW